ncbi:MAG: cellulase family glycosylhydrolase [Nitrososphaerales archaeon]
MTPTIWDPEDIFPPISGTRVSLASDPFGVHLGRKDYIWEFRNEIPTIMQRAHDMGINWIRVHFDWTKIETSQGDYNWEITDDFVSRAENLSISLLVDIEGYPDMALYNESEKATKYNDFVRAFVQRYKDRVD